MAGEFIQRTTTEEPKHPNATKFIREQYDSWTGINVQQFASALTEDTSLQIRLIMGLEALGFHGTINGKIQRSALEECEISFIREILKL